MVQAKLDKERLEQLYVIGVDELSFRRHHEYVTVVVDHLKKRVVWVGEGKGEQTLLKFWRSCTGCGGRSVVRGAHGRETA